MVISFPYMEVLMEGEEHCLSVFPSISLRHEKCMRSHLSVSIDILIRASASIVHCRTKLRIMPFLWRESEAT